MISDETFPIDLDQDELDKECSLNMGSTGTIEASPNMTGFTDFSSCPPSSIDKTITTIDESSFGSFSSKLSLIPPPRAPSKQKKSFSCQDLQQKKPNYDHVESKVKKIIEASQSDRRRVLSRHKSMPISTFQPPIDDDTFSEERDANVLLQELRKKSIKIYELEEKIEEKDSRIYSLEYERSKMRMTFDKLRLEMHELKEKERDYNHLLSISPNKASKNASVQTDDTGTFVGGYNHVRELTYGNESQVLNQTHFSELNNASSDNLIPLLPEMSLDDITRTIETSQTGDNHPDDDRKKKKKIQRFFKLWSCVSSK